MPLTIPSVLNYTIANLPVASEASGQMVRVTDLGNGNTRFYSNGQYWIPVGEVLLAADGLGATLTGTTSETVLATFTFPKKLASPKMTIIINTLWAMTSSVNNKTPRVRFGGVSGTEYANSVITTASSFQNETNIRLRNAVNSQVGMASVPTSAYGISGLAGVTSAIDMSASDTDIVISGQLANSSESITLRAYSICLRG